MADKTLSMAERMKVFQALVDAQDRGMVVAQSRKTIAEQFRIGEEQVRRIEQEGMEGNWPPLG
jgi:hypothetical protein